METGVEAVVPSMKTAVVLYYLRQNRYGLTAAAGALERKPAVPADVRFIRDRARLLAELPGLAAERGRAVVGLSFFTSQAAETAALVPDLRRAAGPRALLVAGGPHPSGDPAGTLGMGFDAAVVGEGEATFRELVLAVNAGRGLEGIRGLAFLDGGRYRFGGRRRPLDLDAWPAWAAGHRKFGPIEITRGCPHGCRFCQATYMFGARPRHRSVATVLDLVRILKGRDILDIRFLTPSAFAYGSPDGRAVSADSLEALLSGVRSVVGPRGRIYFGSFPSEVRPEHVTPESLRIVARHVQNDNLVIGAQSGSARMLSACRRGHTVEDVLRAAELSVAFGFKTYVDFIFGLPGETPEDEAATAAVMEKLAGMGAIIHGHAFMPLPGTPFAGEPPGGISGRLRPVIRRLIARGRLFGEWHRQVVRARKMAAGAGASEPPE